MSAVATPSTEPLRPGALTRDEGDRLRLSFAENGYVILRDVVSRDKLSRLRLRMLEAFEQERGSGGLFSGGGLISGHLNSFPGEEARFVYEALQEKGVFDWIREIFPRPLLGPLIGCNLNLPNSVAQHYHVDSGFLQDFMIANVAVVDTDLVNGAIDVVPGTHKKFYKFWRFAVERPYRHAVRLPLSQGDVLIRTSNLWHRGMPNKSAVPRPMFAVTFEKPNPEPDYDPFRFNEGKIKFYPNWYRPDRLGRLREQTFVVAPFTYSAYRFVRSLFGDKGYTTA
jgi:hypothetical protein